VPSKFLPRIEGRAPNREQLTISPPFLATASSPMLTLLVHDVETDACRRRAFALE